MFYVIANTDWIKDHVCAAFTFEEQANTHVEHLNKIYPSLELTVERKDHNGQ